MVSKTEEKIIISYINLPNLVLVITQLQPMNEFPSIHPNKPPTEKGINFVIVCKVVTKIILLQAGI